MVLAFLQLKETMKGWVKLNNVHRPIFTLSLSP